MGATEIKHVKIKYPYTCYIAEPLSDKIFLMRKFKTRIIFTAKISRSVVVVLVLYTIVVVHTYYSIYRIAGKFDKELNLVVWQLGLKPPN